MLDLLHEGETVQKYLRLSNTPSTVPNLQEIYSRNAQGKCHQCNETIDWQHAERDPSIKSKPLNQLK